DGAALLAPGDLAGARLPDGLGQRLLGALPVRHGEGARDHRRGHLLLGRQDGRRRWGRAWSAFLVRVGPLRLALSRLGRSRHLRVWRRRLRLWRLLSRRWPGALDILLRFVPGPRPGIVPRGRRRALAYERLSLGLRPPVSRRGWRRRR